MSSPLKLIICAAREVTDTIQEAAVNGQRIGTVISIEDFGIERVERDIARRGLPPDQAQEHRLGQGMAPRLHKVLGLVDAQGDPVAPSNPSAAQAMVRDMRQYFLTCNDVEDPKLSHAPRLWQVAWIRGMVAEHMRIRPDTSMMIHCGAGVSRSTALAAAAYIAAHEVLGQPKPGAKSVFDHILSRRRCASPNTLCIAHADAFHAYGGQLVRACQAHSVIRENRAGSVRGRRHRGASARPG